MQKPSDKTWGPPLLWLAALLAAVALPGILNPWLPEKGLLLSRTPLPVLALQHSGMVALSSTLAVFAGVLGGLAASHRAGRDYRPVLLSLTAIGETFPSAAVLALAVPAVGYGWKPTLLALLLYGILPVFRNTLTGLDRVSPAVAEAAAGMGMTEGQILLRVKLPQALPVILSGIRVSVIINVSAATLGATVGAGGLGVPILNGIRSFDTLLMLQGAIPVALLAIFLDSLFQTLEGRAARQLHLRTD